MKIDVHTRADLVGKNMVSAFRENWEESVRIRHLVEIDFSISNEWNLNPVDFFFPFYAFLVEA